ncbi:YfcC family protein [Mucilaginibacter terrae]|uniref:YfcC family protein n=1 Tax=Mucilaginibacter terrae TaxID=1955052 RepID=UPI00362DD886
MTLLNKIPHPLTILMGVIVLAALATWLVPAGKFDTLTYNKPSFTLSKNGSDLTLPATQRTLDSLHISAPITAFEQGTIRKPISVPGTYHRLPKNAQGVISVIEAPIKGLYDTIDIILFVLLIGGFIQVFNATGALEAGLKSLSATMKGREGLLIIILTFLLTFGGASYGMAEEAFAFYPVLVPLFLAAGYDLLVPVAVIFGGTQLGTLSSFSNPFSTIIASNACGISWTDGLNGRLLMFVLSATIYIVYLFRYAQKVRLNPEASLVYRYDGAVQSPFPSFKEQTAGVKLSMRNKLLLVVFFLAFATMITGVVVWHWWLLEMSSVFLIAAVLIAVLQRMDQKVFIDTFIKGAEGLLSVAFIIGAARGVTAILDGGNISDTIVHEAAQLISGLPSGVFIVLLLMVYCLFTLFISSSSGMAVVTMPIIGGLAVAAHVPGREIVNSYLFGMGIMGLVTPTGLLLPSLALVGISIKAWWKFIWPVMVILFVLCAVFLVIGTSI